MLCLNYLFQPSYFLTQPGPERRRDRKLNRCWAGYCILPESKYHHFSVQVNDRNRVTFGSAYVFDVAVAELDHRDGAAGPTSRAEVMSTGDLRS